MRKSNIVANFNFHIEAVWNVVTDNTKYAWRSDLAKIEVIDEKTFIEYTKNGFQTRFTITLMEPCFRYEFDMENRNFVGHWTGIFTKTGDNGTRIEFLEELKIKNPILEVLSYIFMNLKKMQFAYVNDLNKELGKN